MKNIHILLGVSLILLGAACTTAELRAPEEPQPETSLTGIVAIMPPVDDPDTKSDVSESSGKLSFSWNDDDVLGIVPLDGKTPQTNYDLSASDEGAAATFDGGSWAVKAGHEYAAYLPYQAIVATSSDMISISLDDQVQVGNNDVSHLGNYNIMYAGGTATGDDAIQLNFTRLAGFFRFEMEGLPAGTYTSVIISAEDDVFAKSATLDLESGTLSPANMTNTITLQLEDVVIEENEVLNAWMASAPVPIANKTITVTAVSAEGSESYIFRTSSDLSSNKTKWPVLTKPVDSAILPSGQVFNAAVKSAAGGNAQNIHKISFKTGQVVTNTEAGYDITYNSETNEVVVSTNAEEFKLPADASHMFDGLNEMTEIDGMDKINTSAVTNMACMFNECLELRSLDVSGFETSSVTDMQRMFDSCRSLSALDLASFDTERVTMMYAMFNNCQVLADLNISSFRTPSVEVFTQMFYGCSAIERLDLSMWDVSRAYGFARMFKNCKKLSWLNIEGWNLDLAKNYGASYHEDIFSGIAASNIGIDIASQKPTPLNLYCDEPALVTVVGWLRECGCDLINWLSSRPTEIPVLPSGLDFNNIIMTKAGGYDQVGSIIFSSVNNVYDLKGENILDTYPGIYVYVEDYGGTTKDVYVSTLAPKMEANTDCSGMFSDFDNVQSIIGWSDVNTSNVANANSMFAHCESLINSDIQYMSTESMTSMLYMFSYCYKFDFGDQLKNFSTSNATDMEGMFHDCYALTDLDLSSFNTLNVTCMDYMFENCDNLKRIVFGDYFTVTNNCSVNDIINNLGSDEEGARAMFVCSKGLWDRLTEDAKETGYNSSKHFREADYAWLPKDFIDHTYSYNSTHPIKRIVFITGSSYNDGTAMEHTEGAPVYREYQSAGYNTEAGKVEYEYRVYTSAKEFRLPEDASGFFDLSQASVLEEIEGLEYLNTSAVTNMSGMFRNARIPYLDLHSFDVSRVTDMSEMFYSTDIKVINLDGFKTSSLTNMSNMFYASTKLEKIDMPTFDLTKVTNCSGAFGRCDNLYAIRLGSQFIIGNGCSTDNMFESLGSAVDASLHSGYNTTFYCTQNIFEGYIGNRLPQGYRYRYVGSADVGFDGGDDDGGRMAD